MTEKQYHVQKIYKGMNDGVKIHDWCVMKDDTVILRLSTRMDCKDVVEVLNKVADENEKLKQQRDFYLHYVRLHKLIKKINGDVE